MLDLSVDLRMFLHVETDIVLVELFILLDGGTPLLEPAHIDVHPIDRVDKQLLLIFILVGIEVH